MRIYFVRHSTRDVNIKDDYNAPLTEDGQLKAEKLVKVFENKKIHNIYVSPYKRAIDTIKPVANSLNIEYKIELDLFERKIGEWVEDFEKFCFLQWLNFDYKLENGESLNEVLIRMLKVFNKIKDENCKDIIICGHGTSLSILFYKLTFSNFTYNDFKSLTMPDVLVYDVDAKSLEKYFK
ncbi:histidine phosphatase family protein [Staphylococcus caeli]|uniref:histidine phosphatase family protein n=1 Tax=Staphylococcus caeli TaxID=2201815 RepID=UPI003F55C23C